MELNVFIIDDDHSVTEQLPCLVRNWAAHRNMNVNIVTKNDLSEVTPTLVSAFDLVMLDIEIGEENGIEFARSLRDLGSDATIAFISNFERYAIEGYSVHAVSYLLKPLKKDAVETLLDEAATRTGDISSNSIRISQNGRYRFISTRSILYIEVFNKKVTFHLTDKEESFYTTISGLEPQLAGTTLVRCHRSYIINLEYIQEIGSNYISLYQVDTKIPIGKSYLPSVKAQLFQKRSL